MVDEPSMSEIGTAPDTKTKGGITTAGEYGAPEWKAPSIRTAW
jgi:hypothetical protein